MKKTKLFEAEDDDKELDIDPTLDGTDLEQEIDPELEDDDDDIEEIKVEPKDEESLVGMVANGDFDSIREQIMQVVDAKIREKIETSKNEIIAAINGRNDYEEDVSFEDEDRDLLNDEKSEEVDEAPVTNEEDNDEDNLGIDPELEDDEDEPSQKDNVDKALKDLENEKFEDNIDVDLTDSDLLDILSDTEVDDAEEDFEEEEKDKE